jgi:hypothetical protein
MQGKTSDLAPKSEIKTSHDAQAKRQITAEEPPPDAISTSKPTPEQNNN